MKMGFLKRSLCLIAVLLAFCLAFAGCEFSNEPEIFDEFTNPPTSNQTNKKTEKPTEEQTEEQTEKITSKPTQKPTEVIIEKPTQKPTEALTQKPTEVLTERPSESLTEKPTEIQTEETVEDTTGETAEETAEETVEETVDETTAETEGSTSSVGEQREAEKALGVSAFSGKPFFVLNDNIPDFTEAQKQTVKSFEFYSELDPLGRCGYTEACVGKDIMPTEDRESISSVKPSGWINKKYDTALVDGGYIYNRCHLIGFQLTGENANKQNLITGTRYMNVDGMLPFENMIADYVKETENHVMYRVTPIYDGNDLVACGVKLEAYSVEDEGEGIMFNVYVYNVQPGIVIDYATGDSWLSGESIETSLPTETDGKGSEEGEIKDYVLNTSSKKIHLPTCSGANSMSEANRKEVTGYIGDFLIQGYDPCGICKPAA